MTTEDGAPSGDALRNLCERHGIEPAYDDIWGHRHAVPADAMRRLLAAAGAFDDETAAPDDGLPPVLVVRIDGPVVLPPQALAGHLQLRWRIALEDGGEAHGSAARASETDAWHIAQTLPPGYHRLTIEGQGGATVLVCAPATCHQPETLADGARLWGVALQLYGLRSPRNWGIGDFGDLKAFVTEAAQAGAALVGLNPLHALFPHNPVHASPYSPSSRAQLNVLYIDVEALPDFRDDPDAQALVQSASFQARLARLRAAALVDYAGVSAAKHEVLALLHRRFLARPADDEEVRAYAAFTAQGGDALRQHALFDAVQAHWHARDAAVWGWPAWPEAWRDPHGEAVQVFAREHARQVDYFAYLQWQAARQLRAVGRHCRAIGMPVGLYLDLAVSVDRGGSDTWRHAGSFALDASVGAPPDLLNLQGQDWGLPPLRPDRLRSSGFTVFIEALRANMRAAGALRIDHVMMLMRLFWIPAGGSGADGAYVRYPMEELFAVLALESRRHQCLVVGEDLGTVPDAMREAMHRHGVLSYRLLYFQRDAQGGFLAPQDYPREAVVAVSTHDLPPLGGWWGAADVRLRGELGMAGDADALREAMAARAHERARLAEVLDLPAADGEAEVDAGAPPAQAVVAAHAFLARTPCALMVVQLEDLLGQAEQANLPGTVAEHPNWQRKYALEVAAIWRDRLARQVCDAVVAERPARMRSRIPRATYRLQLHKDFGFDEACAVVPYLARLGISHVYCSPIQRARSGSLHGYDVVAHDQINPELGGLAGYLRLGEALRAHGMGQLIDVVPNHMGVLGTDNAWWNDVLEKGMGSPYADHFDIDWASATPGLAGKVLLPVLGDAYGEVLERGELALAHEPASEDGRSGRWFVQYFEHRFPVAPQSVPAFLQAAADDDAVAGSAALARALDDFNGPGQRDALHALLEAQSWRLAHWRCAADEINYRRFFDVNELVALRTERLDVFRATHALALDLAAQGVVDGLRIDHPDGLFDPAAYFARLQAGFAARRHALGASADALYVVAEKIAAAGEDVPRAWPIHGTTGYRFANVVNAVLVDERSGDALRALWAEFTGEDAPFEEVVYASRLAVGTSTLAADLEVLANALHRIAKADRRTRDHTLNSLRAAIAGVAAAMPVYRTYNGETASAQDRRHVALAVDGARARLGDTDAALWAFVHDALLGRLAPGVSDDGLPDVRRFARRFQQYSAPVAAKGVEDTAFYRYFPLASLNEVGGEPDRIGMSVAQFHEASADRQRRWPHTRLASSTHDNKRSEDVRLRINVLSECTGAWGGAVQQWRRLNAGLAQGVLPAHEYLLYQTVVGAAPSGMGDAADEAFADRMVAYMRKAAREGKNATSWTRPDADYEQRLEDFVRGALAGPTSAAFRRALAPWVAGADALAALGALSLAVLKFTAPGVPDLYQGCELIDHSLVDPDNRRPVDFDARARSLDGLQALADAPRDRWAGAVADMARAAGDGRAKLWTIWRLLELHRHQPELFLHGSYEPLAVRGPRAAHVIAYLRRHRGQVLVVVALRLFARLALPEEGPPPTPLPAPLWQGEALWGDTRVLLPDDAAVRACDWRDVLTRQAHGAGPALSLSALTQAFPGAVLMAAD